MADFSQANRRLRITTPLGDDVLLLSSLTGVEGISTLFTFDAELIGRDETVDFDAIVGQNVTISILRKGGDRYVNGIVSRFAQGGTVRAHATYRAEIVPWLWFLTRTADCRIFQNKTVPDIVTGIFKEYGFSDYKLKLQGAFPQWEYCVQYRETDYNFVARLLEEEGIFFYFEHEDGKHTLVLANTPSAHEPCPGTSELRYIHDMTVGDEEDVVTRFMKEQEVRPGKYASTDYNFETPSLDLMAKATGTDTRKYELYDYPGAGGSPAKRERLEALVRIRQQEEDATRVTCAGGSYCRSLTPGYLFDLEGVGAGAVSRFDGTYLVTSVRHHASEAFEPVGDAPGLTYANEFQCTELKVPYRPARRTPRPMVNGVQTAVVVGPAGEEIFVDRYGRVKVQFFWDREGKKNEHSTCWIRVAHGWAGKNWGMIANPRIGQEVIVSFLEGDPDCPLITGRVYNAEQMPPYELPANMTQTGIKSRSSRGGTPANFNEIRFEDKKGREEVYIHAEKDENHVVEHDETEMIGNDRVKTIGRDKTESVGRNKSIQVASNHTEQIGSAMSIVVGTTLTETVGINYAETVGGAMELTVGAALAITVGAAMAETVGGAKTEAIGGSKSENIGSNRTMTVGSNLTETVRGNQTVTVAKDLQEKIEGKHREEVAKEYMVSAKKMQFVAEDEISLKTGSAEIIMKKNGDITIKGNKISVKGSGDVIIKGSKIKEN
jgi:type VI secretion system secreted protein VgrG